jgi:hypothetical protein
MKREFVSELLTLLEQAESRLLSWGFYDGGFRPAEVDDLIRRSGPPELQEAWKEMAAGGTNLNRLLDDMRQAGILYQPRNNQDVVRTRFAETVRLLARLRQMFRVQDWNTGPRLVRDLKIHLRPRRYPKRDITPGAVWADIARDIAATPEQRQAFDVLSRVGDGSERAYSGFQSRATGRILNEYLRNDRFSGTVVCAGTGSGKTKAFYVPALVGVVGDILQSERPYTKVVAVYPRNVLLADQLREAISEAAKLTTTLAERFARPITIGALLGDLPPADQFQRANSKFLTNWKRVDRGWVVPFLRSPMDGKSALVWRDVDRVSGRTSLYHTDAPATAPPAVPNGILALTRDDLQAKPPDILFVSLEMLNREIGNPQWAATFGIDHAGPSPKLLLLDEVHSYSGLAGAQIPWIIRRWILAGRFKGLHVVGLSATLHESIVHLRNVTGLPAASIQEVAPINDADPARSELISEGIEYNVAVRGATTAGASLLATSIQAAMLLARVLTPDNQSDAKDDDKIVGSFFYARKVFGFTDNLDSLNRWLSNTTNADNQLALASLRAWNANPTIAAFQEGQIWDLPETLGYDLRQTLQIDRCSSQEPGIDPRARLVLATSSLEVGYDDPEVGIVLQHKAPSNLASFIQRKGRAGRRRGTRPITVAVLSDFGRDRWAYKDSHRLFGDAIDRIRLPALNPYVLKIQASWFLIDSIGRYVGRPDPLRYLVSRTDITARNKSRAFLEALLAGDSEFRKFCMELRAWIEPYLLSVTPSGDVQRNVDAILWDAPRPLMRQVVPALLKELEWIPVGTESSGRNWPIAEYIPKSTFSEIDSHEIAVTFTNDAQKEASIESSRFLFEFCPGRVSKRFATRRGEVGYWPTVSSALTGATPCYLDVASVASGVTFIRELDGVPVYEAQGVTVTPRPANIRDSSQGSWDAQFYAESVGAGTDAGMFGSGVFGQVFSSTRAYLHRNNDGIRVLRYADRGSYEILGDRDLVIRGRFALATGVSAEGDQQRQAIGFERVTDGLIFDVDARHLVDFPALPNTLLERFRTDRFLHELLQSETLQRGANSFAIGYLFQTSLTMLSATALAQRCSLKEAQRMLKGRRGVAAAAAIGRLLGGADDDDLQAGANPARRHTQIVSLWGDPVVEATVEAAEKLLWEPKSWADSPWLVRRYVETLAQAINSAIVALLPDAPEGDLAVDVLILADQFRIIVSETTGGGLGHVESLLMKMVGDATQFERAVRSSLVHCAHESESTSVLGLAEQTRRGEAKPLMVEALAAIRRARSFSQIESAKETLRRHMTTVGLDASRASVLGIMSAVLRPGSNGQTDRWIRGLNVLWRQKSAGLGIAIPTAVFAYWCSRHSPISRRFSATLEDIAGETPSDQQLFLALEGLLQEGCADSCPECLGTGRPTQIETKPSRSLALNWIGLSQEESPLRYRTEHWMPRVRESLSQQGRATIVSALADLDACISTLGELCVDPIEADYLLVAASLTELRRSGLDWVMVWETRGLTQNG